jgi:hypothetical protein
MLNVSRTCYSTVDAEELLRSTDSSPSDDSDKSLQKNLGALKELIVKMKIISTNHWPWYQDAPEP